MTEVEPPMPVPRLLKYIYWRMRRNPRVSLHLAAVLLGFGRHYLALWVRKRLGRARPTMAIALVEHMGDIVAAEPIARAARQSFPRHRIVWMSKYSYRELATSYQSIDRVVTVRCLTETMLLHAAGILDATWDLHLRGRICEQCCIPVVKPGPGPDMDDYFRFGNLITTQCLSAGIPPVQSGPMLVPPARAVSMVDRLGLPERFVAIHCTSSDGIRDWPTAKWQHLVATIASDLQIDVIELGLRPVVIMQDSNRLRSLCGQLSIMQTAEVIRRATLFIGIDSGPAHLANAVGTQGVLLLGSYLGMDDYMPYSGGYQNGDTGDLLRAAGAVQNLPVAAVLAAVACRLQARDTPNDAARSEETGCSTPGVVISR